MRSQQKEIFGIAILALALLACLISTATSSSLPAHTVNDFWDNGKGTNFAYFIVADKSLTEEDANRLISYYQDRRPGYKIMNIWIFCDDTYADEKYLNDNSVSDDQFFSHVMYWSLSGEWTNVGTSLQTKADNDLPTFRSACK